MEKQPKSERLTHDQLEQLSFEELMDLRNDITTEVRKLKELYRDINYILENKRPTAKE
jgi:hypothetical protein